MEKDYLKTRFEPEEFEKLKKKLVRYECALDVVRTQLSNLNTYYNNFEAINPIEHIKHRLKSPESIAGKLKKKDLPVTADAADEHLSDIAGIRIICSYAKNIYEIVEIIKSQEAFTVVSEKDYLRNVKKTGYRSYHMIVEVNLGHLLVNKRVELKFSYELRQWIFGQRWNIKFVINMMDKFLSNSVANYKIVQSKFMH